LMLCDNDDARYGLFPLFIHSSFVFRQDRNQGRMFAPVSLQSRQNDRDQPVMLSLLSPYSCRLSLKFSMYCCSSMWSWCCVSFTGDLDARGQIKTDGCRQD
jgi:hypothetical protein